MHNFLTRENPDVVELWAFWFKRGEKWDVKQFYEEMKWVVLFYQTLTQWKECCELKKYDLICKWFQEFNNKLKYCDAQFFHCPFRFRSLKSNFQNLNRILKGLFRTWDLRGIKRICKMHNSFECIDNDAFPDQNKNQ